MSWHKYLKAGSGSGLATTKDICPGFGQDLPDEGKPQALMVAALAGAVRGKQIRE